MKPLVSLIVVNYNGFEVARNCLESLFETIEKTASEVILVDNNSTDQSSEKLREIFSAKTNFRILMRERNDFLAAAYNDGAKSSQGEILVFMNNDLVFAPGWLEELLRVFETEKVGVAGSAVLSQEDRQTIDNLGGHLDVLGFGQRADSGKKHNPDQGLQFPFYIQGALLAIRRSIFEEVGGFDPTYLANYEDVDLCWRVRLLGYQVCANPRSVVYHLGSWTVKKYLGNENSSSLCRKNRLTTLLKNAGTAYLVCVLPAYLLSQLVVFLKECLFDRNIRLALTSPKAIYYNVGNLKTILAKRGKVQRSRKISDVQILKAMDLI